MDSIEPVVANLTKSIEEGTFIEPGLLKETEDGISLLALKNEVLLSYISNLLILSAAQLEKKEHAFDEARQRTIEQRVTLEKGIKGLEAKISYQIDKVLRAYKRFQEQQVESENRKANEEEAGSDSDEDLTSYRPDISSLTTGSGSSKKSSSSRSRRSTNNDDDDDSGLDDDDKKRYVVPKISSTAPAFEKEKTRRTPRNRRDVAMEEYIHETGDAPVAEPSIGSQIMDSGRGGERTARDRKKANDIKAYEEANYTRISQTSTKRARKEAAQRQRDAISKSFFGEDWGFLDGDNNRGGGKKRKTKH